MAAAEAAKQAARARKAEQREAALVVRRALADEAESLRDSTSWKATTERYAAIVEEWKALPRGDRGAEQELWQRISAARTAFDKRRRAHFSELDGQRKDALTRKRELIAQAEALSTSTDWQRTSKQLRDLMADWKNAPRGLPHGRGQALEAVQVGAGRVLRRTHRGRGRRAGDASLERARQGGPGRRG